MQKGIFSKMVAIVFMISCLLVVTQTKTYAAAGDEQLNRTSIILIVNGEKGDYSTKYGKATLRVLNSTGAPTFKSSNKKIATVGTDGVVTAVKAGTCNITAKIGKKTYTCKVTVKNAYSKKSLKENFKLSSKVENGFVKFTVVNKYNHPMYVDIIGKEIKADGSNSSTNFSSEVPAKATTYFWKKLSAPTSSFIFEKRTFSYTNGSGVGRYISDNQYLAYMYSTGDFLTFSSSKLGFTINEVRVEPYEGWFDSGMKVYVDGNFHNSTPISISNGYQVIAPAYIMFYNKGKIVQMVSLNTSGFSGTGKMKMENKEVAKFTDWDGVYDNYKVVINSKSLIKVQ